MFRGSKARNCKDCEETKSFQRKQVPEQLHVQIFAGQQCIIEYEMFLSQQPHQRWGLEWRPL